MGTFDFLHSGPVNFNGVCYSDPNFPDVRKIWCEANRGRRPMPRFAHNKIPIGCFEGNTYFYSVRHFIHELEHRG